MSAFVLALAVLPAALVEAQEPATASEPLAAAPSPPTPPEPPRPYSVPLLLRPLPAVNVVRLDTVVALHDAYGPAASGLAADVVQIVTVGVRATDWLMLLARGGWDHSTEAGTSGFANLVLGANFTTPIERTFRFSGFVGVGLPIGTDASGSPIHRNARWARMAMDNALFNVDHLAAIGGVGAAWIDAGWTLQAEATLLVFGRVEGTGDEAIVNSSFGLLVGYFVVPELSLLGELHHQHFLSDPVALRTDPYGGELRSQTSGSLGVRAHLSFGTVRVRPALAWSVGFDPPLAGDAWQSIHLDVPVFF